MGPIIDLTNLFPYRIIILFAYSFACYNIVHSILKDKYHTVITFVSIFLIRLITSLVFFNYENINILGYLSFSAALVILLLFITNGKVYIKCMCVLFNLISHMLSSLIMAVLMLILFNGKDYYEIYQSDNENLIYLYLFLIECVVIITVSFLFAGILKLFNSNRCHTHNKKIYAYFSFLPFSHILIIIVALFLNPYDINDMQSLNTGIDVIITLMTLLIILFDCSFPFIIDYFERLEERNITNEKKLLKNEFDYQQMMMLKEEKQRIRKIKHDLINITTTAKGFIEIGAPDRATAILQNTTDDLAGIKDICICKNETINTILYMKTKQADRYGIALNINISEEFYVAPNDYDLCRILGNLIDNALNAVNQLKSNRECNIDIDINMNHIIITTENHFTKSGTKRIDKTGIHGNGTTIIKEIAKKYDGKFTQKQKDDIWYTKTLLVNKNGADSTPPRKLSLFETLRKLILKIFSFQNNILFCKKRKPTRCLLRQELVFFNVIAFLQGVQLLCRRRCWLSPPR